MSILVSQKTTKYIIYLVLQFTMPHVKSDCYIPHVFLENEFKALKEGHPLSHSLSSAEILLQNLR